ncbi:L-dopachrome tautomerase-related protein [Commensalibacter nepenthis]|uniref:L-dopachrome tautomerase-related protein n=1 Tax=Commensalibacter nepenthis TaxID=3043872 RepID=A0ABT6QA14_9PROT|nr:L-dopachrome tautomerase-related protein [Commensalibacter sp. TBRC 10068]MDI2113639.1 L-dopachrome tautomerase-related protein [Commensalibacter sp. TBRC 10068]
MILLKPFTRSVSFALALIFIAPSLAHAKQKLDQPALLSSDALKQVASVKGYLPDYIVVDDKERMIAQFPRLTDDKGLSLAIVKPDNTLTPYPNEEWNNINTQNLSKHFIGLTGMTLTPDGILWVLDSGIPKVGATPIKNAAKIITIDTKTDQVLQTYPIPDSVFKEKTALNAIAVYDHHIYIADEGAPAIIVFDTKTGQARRLLENSPSLYSRLAVVANNQVVKPNLDQSSHFNVNQLAISPDGKRLYYQAVSGPLYRIDTMYLNDATYSPAELNEAMMIWFKTPSSGGIVCGPDGTLYIDDIATNSVYRFTTGRILNKLITDPRLKWPAHPFISKNNVLYIPTIQFDQTQLLNKQDHSTIQWPLYIYSLTPPALQNK